jgi:hypothetical protein
VQLDRIPPRQTFRFPGTPSKGHGVPQVEPDRTGVELELVPRPGHVPAEADVEPVAPSYADEHTRRGLAARGWAFVALACLMLLGQGERFQVDARFRTPGRTLETYWRAIRHNDLQTVGECFSDAQSMPFPGMLWFLPPVDALHIRSLHVVSAEGGKIVAAYEIQFVPQGSQEAESFVTSSELVRVGYEWRIVPAENASSMPPWKPYPRPVDS